MKKQKAYEQHDWTNKALIADGFLAYRPVKRITMARILPPEEAPKTIKTSWDTLTAKAGYWIAYVAGSIMKKKLDDYHPRPIAPTIFSKTYLPWDEPNWKPSPTEAHLKKMGCMPYYKTASVWAKRLTVETWVQGLESDKPALSPKGSWLCIGTAGEPWSVTQAWFKTRYQLPREKDAASV